MSIAPEDVEAALRRLQTTSGPGDSEWQPLWMTLIRGVARDADELKRLTRKLFPSDAESLLEQEDA